jgi:hypothetical protein
MHHNPGARLFKIEHNRAEPPAVPAPDALILSGR